MPFYLTAGLLLGLTVTVPANDGAEVPSTTTSVSPRAPNRYCTQAPALGVWITDRPCRSREEWRRNAIDLVGLR